MVSRRMLLVHRCASSHVSGVVLLFALLLASGCGKSAPAGNSTKQPGSTQQDLNFDGNSKQLRRTQIVPTLATPIEKEKNVIWCASFLAAWKELQHSVAKGPVDLTGAEDVSNRLNEAPDPRGNMPADAFYAAAGWARDGIVNTIHSEMRKRFPQRAAPGFPGVRGDSLIAYAYLATQVKFTIPYFQNQEPLVFKDSAGDESRIRSFGLRFMDEGAYYNLRSQIRILFRERQSGWDGETFFALDLCRDSQPNQLVFARVPLKETLKATLDDVKKRIARHVPGEQAQTGLGSNDDLLVPDMAWRVMHHFPGIEGKSLASPSTGRMPIDYAQQEIEFRLNRSGAELESEVKFHACSMGTSFKADSPFLLYIQKRGSEHPFFVMWVDNAELLQKWDGPEE